MKHLAYILTLSIIPLFFSCSQKQPYSDSPLIGDWNMEYSISYSDTSANPDIIILDEAAGIADTIYPEIDLTKSYWEAHDPLNYSFSPDGTLIVSGGPEPLDGVKCSFSINGDTLAISSDYFRFNAYYEILSIVPDTIWLCEFELGSKFRNTSDYKFLVRH